MAEHTRSVTAADASAAAAAVAGNEHLVGQWGPVVDWPVVGVHVALMPERQGARVRLRRRQRDRDLPGPRPHARDRWDPATGTQTPVWVDTGSTSSAAASRTSPTGRCSSPAATRTPSSTASCQTHVFDPSTNTWSARAEHGRGPLVPDRHPAAQRRDADHRGRPGHARGPHDRRRPAALNTASLGLPLYPWIDVAPDGRAFYSGPDQTMRSLDTNGSGAWQTFGQRDAINRDYGSHALYDIGKILVAGGGGSSKDARVIDINGATPQVTADGVDGERAPPAQPDRAGRRQRARDRRQLLRSARSSTSPTASTPPSAGTRPPAPGRRWRPSR